MSWGIRSKWMTTGAALAGLLVAAPLRVTAAETDVERQIREMQQRMQKVDDQIQAASDQLESANQRVDEQSQLIEQSGLAETRGATNGMPGFLGQIKIGGNVQASYIWNLNHPTDQNRDDLAGHLGNGIRGQALVGAICAGLAAYASVRFLLRFFETRTLTPFAIYCLVFGAASVVRFA